MHEILRELPAGGRVLDIGSAKGSFQSCETLATVIRLDRENCNAAGALFVQGDAARLPFADGTIDAVVSNHSLEHFDDLDGALREIARVTKKDGSLFVSVPDAATVTDRLYRWLARGGGHVNQFTSAEELIDRIVRATKLKHRGTRLLYSSLSFLNARNASRPRPRRLFLLGGGAEWSLFLYVLISRSIDKWFNLRTGIYGWSLYFGGNTTIDPTPWPNVCIRCGSAAPEKVLAGADGKRWLVVPVYSCTVCGAKNPWCR